MSPRTTLTSWGSSSSRYRRNVRPTLVTRGSPASVSFEPLRSVVIVRTLRIVNSSPPSPTRRARYRNGPRSPDSRMATAAQARMGAAMTRPIVPSTTSIARFTSHSFGSSRRSTERRPQAGDHARTRPHGTPRGHRHATPSRAKAAGRDGASWRSIPGSCRARSWRSWSAIAPQRPSGQVAGRDPSRRRRDARDDSSSSSPRRWHRPAAPHAFQVVAPGIMRLLEVRASRHWTSCWRRATSRATSLGFIPLGFAIGLVPRSRRKALRAGRGRGACRS